MSLGLAKKQNEQVLGIGELSMAALEENRVTRRQLG